MQNGTHEKYASFFWTLTNGILGDVSGVEGRERRLKEELEVISPGPEQRATASARRRRLGLLSRRFVSRRLARSHNVDGRCGTSASVKKASFRFDPAPVPLAPSRHVTGDRCASTSRRWIRLHMPLNLTTVPVSRLSCHFERRLYRASMRLPLAALVAASLLSSAHAGMYGQPVVNLDARTFKQALSVEHAAVSRKFSICAL
jgi:hypothetical protein